MNELQKKELAIYNEIAKVCNKHNLKFFAIGGTCIGAVRHKGFIPWDDDIDIALPRRDYELLRTQFYKELPQYLQLLDYDNSKQYLYLFSKIHDSRTTFVLNNAKNSPEKYTGAFVDIMPIDGLPNNLDELEVVFKRMRRLDFANNRHRPVPMSIYQGSYSGPFKWMARRLFSLVHEYNYYSTNAKELGEQYDFNKSEYCIFTWRAGSRDLARERIVFPRRFFDTLIDVPFENSKMRIPAAYDEYLTQDFGDYMKIPPEEEQRSIHAPYIIDMNTPCSYYSQRDTHSKKNWRIKK